MSKPEVLNQIKPTDRVKVVTVVNPDRAQALILATRYVSKKTSNGDIVEISRTGEYTDPGSGSIVKVQGSDVLVTVHTKDGLVRPIYRLANGERPEEVFPEKKPGRRSKKGT